MSQRPADLTANVPDATSQVAQERDGAPSSVATQPAATAFACDVGPGVTRAARVRPYHRHGSDPLYRPLRIYTLDPAQPRLEGALAVVNVPYEPVEPGPVGALFEVDNHDLGRHVRYARVDLDAPNVLIASGRDPSPSDVQFHQQMVYAVCSSVYAAFRGALGRDVAWGFGAAPGQGNAPNDPDDPAYPLRLRLVPHAMRERNAFYSPATGAIHFGYDRAKGDEEAKNPPGGYVFTCLSHDIIAHEFSHALLHGLREQFLFATQPDVPAFHEAFGDLVAIFQHFAYEDVVATAIAKCGPHLDQAGVLAELARQFGYTTLSGPGRKALRTAIDIQSSDALPLQQYDKGLESHELGSVLVSAVFEAFVTLFRRKTARYVRLATNGSGVLPTGAIPHELHKILAGEASQLASQILCLCVRAIDYCPPVDLEFGDYLRALITADAELVADDPWAYREALVDAFGRRGIFPADVGNLAEDSLRWRPPWRPIEIPALQFANLRFSGDPARAARPEDLLEQADALRQVVTDPRYFAAFGLAVPDGREFKNPCINSIRTARRVGPDGQVLFDLVAEVTQERRITTSDGSPAVLYGGSTVIVDPEGWVRYLIVKNVRNPRRLEECQAALGPKGSARQFWIEEEGRLVPNKKIFELMHSPTERAAKSTIT